MAFSSSLRERIGPMRRLRKWAVRDATAARSTICRRLDRYREVYLPKVH
ncbi:hypothetical protein C4K04_5940 [Pseudomonas chlororaphis]|uniref:Uncharacterized protein n=1 Tax=Pseudomonas chlororaphis TaxID=587753 RepID=A0A3G7TZ16_9PSED|nr:hypothetical protein C4K04_5940 [Pseudomonas chlororaphis]